MCKDGFSFQIVNIYAPNTKNDAPTFFSTIIHIISTDLPVIMCGDFNTVVNASKDRMGCNINSPWAYNWSSILNNLMTTFGLCDVFWRLKYPDKREFTWHRSNRSQASRLDMFWIPRNLFAKVKKVEIHIFGIEHEGG